MTDHRMHPVDVECRQQGKLVEYEGMTGMGYDDPEIDFGYDTFAISDPWPWSPGTYSDESFVELMGASDGDGTV